MDMMNEQSLTTIELLQSYLACNWNLWSYKMKLLVYLSFGETLRSNNILIRQRYLPHSVFQNHDTLSHSPPKTKKKGVTVLPVTP